MTSEKNIGARAVGHLFDGIASSYDNLNSLFSLGIHRYWKQVLIRKKNISGGWILDICTGTADTGIAYAEHDPRSRVVGLDRSALMLEYGKEKIANKKLESRFRLLQADGLDMPFFDGSFDLVFNSFGLRNEEDYPKALGEMARVLKPAGSVNILEFSLPSNRLLRAVYTFYLSNIMPAVSGFFLKDRKAFQYLAETIQRFPAKEKVRETMISCGFKRVEIQTLTGGIVCIYRGYLETNQEGDKYAE